MPEQTKVREHQWVEMTVTPVTILGVDDHGHPVVMPTPMKETQTTVGCFACNMGLDEGLTVACPGQDLFEEPG